MARAKVKLNGGPSDGKWIDYEIPLPKVLVIPEVSSHSTKFHDYVRTGKFSYQFREK